MKEGRGSDHNWRWLLYNRKSVMSERNRRLSNDGAGPAINFAPTAACLADENEILIRPFLLLFLRLEEEP